MGIITVEGDYSLTVFASSRINRLDFINKEFAFLKYPVDVLDMVELSEEESRERSHLSNPARLEKRLSPKQSGELAMVFVEVEMTGGNRIFLAPEISVALATERFHRLRLLFSTTTFHFRLRPDGAAVLNLKNLVRFTINPGTNVTAAEAWPAHYRWRSQNAIRELSELAPLHDPASLEAPKPLPHTT